MFMKSTPGANDEVVVGVVDLVGLTVEPLPGRQRPQAGIRILIKHPIVIKAVFHSAAVK